MIAAVGQLMMVVRRAQERRHDRSGQHESWLTFDALAGGSSLAHGFNSLQILNESRLSPGRRGLPHPHLDAEIITYVLQGSLAYDDSMGRSGVLDAGEFRRTTAHRGVSCTETNASGTDSAHVFQLWLRSRKAGNPPGQEQKRFSAAERRGRLCLVASSDARMGSLHLREDVRVYSALLARGHHVVHDLVPGRASWLQVVTGQVMLRDAVLSAGDGAGVSGERPISFTAREETEILLLDLVERPSEWPRRAAAQRLDWEDQSDGGSEPAAPADAPSKTVTGPSCVTRSGHQYGGATSILMSHLAV